MWFQDGWEGSEECGLWGVESVWGHRTHALRAVLWSAKQLLGTSPSEKFLSTACILSVAGVRGFINSASLPTGISI